MTLDLNSLFDVDATISRTHDFDFLTQYALYGLTRLRENIRDQADHDNIEIGFEILSEKLQSVRHEDFFFAWDCWEENPQAACDLLHQVAEDLAADIFTRPELPRP